jgi:predicted RNase H-like HicB family nuclease
MVLQLNGAEPAFQIRQTARPIEFEAALRGAPGFCRSRLRQELDECLHLLLRQDGQSLIFGDQCVSAHNKSCYPQPAGVAIRHLDDSSGFNSPLSAIRPVLIHPGEDGYWVAECPSLPGCVSQGATREESIRNIQEAIEGYIAVLREDGLPVPEDKLEELLLAV